MGNDVAAPLNTVAKTTVKAANTTVYATKVAVNKTVEAVTDPSVGRACMSIQLCCCKLKLIE